MRGRYRLNQHEAMRKAVRDGLGIGLPPAWAIEDDLRAGTVKALLRDYTLPH